MKASLANFRDSFYVARAIAAKDIVDAMKSKATRTNILVMVAMVFFFSWYDNVRPWDKRIDTVVYDQGNANLELDTRQLTDGYTFQFYEASSMQEMERTMVYKGMGLAVGIVLPADFDDAMNVDDELSLDGYILWAHRRKLVEWEALYSEKLTELLGRPVHLEMEGNIVIPPPGIQSTSTNFSLLFAIFWMAIMVVPSLMLEEKRTGTLNALLVSPASARQVVAGKALTGLFYVGLAGGLSIAFNWVYVTQWGLASLAMLGTVIFAIGSGLALGSILQSAQQLNLWGWVINIFLLIPALIALDPLLTDSLRALLSWLPTTALVKLFQFSFSAGVSWTQVFANLAIALGWTGLVFATVVWKVHQADR
jgi:ABC-2 type transport system permease protein